MYERPATLNDALDLLQSGPWSVLAGGTDFYPMLGEKKPDRPVLDITAIAELNRLEKDGEDLVMGAAVTWTQILRADLPAAFDGLKLAAREVGSIQIQNRATVAGNLCNASPAADGVPPLLTLDAEVEIAGRAGDRRLPLAAFIQGNRATALGEGEIVTSVRIPGSAMGGHSDFLKLGSRAYLVISIAMVAARIVPDAEGRIGEAAIAVGACSEVAQRLSSLETALSGQPWKAETSQLISPVHLAALRPIDDIRAPASYRQIAAAELVRRVVARTLAKGHSRQ